MKLQFKHQAYQAAAVQAVVDCFKGQLPNDAARRYLVDPGKLQPGQTQSMNSDEGFKNADIQITPAQLLSNIQQVQRHQNLPQSTALAKDKVSDINLDIEMETGTGKTYCYLKSIFELHAQYGWSKFIIVVPSIAIREGVHKSLEITAEHFLEGYGKRARSFIYNSKQLHELESFSSSADIQVMVINVQAFNATGKDNRRIYEELDDFQSRRPIDVIARNKPILILDEPQKMEGVKTLASFANFNPLFILRYSATLGKEERNKIYRLDALDAYNQKLVKKIAVRGIAIRGLTGTNAYLYFQGIEISSTKPPVARLEFEFKQNNGIKRITRKLSKGTNLFDESNGLGQYQGFVVNDINANTDVVSFTNGVELYVGDATGDVHEHELRRIQIRETIKAHFEKEQQLFSQGIKVLSLFFIDEVAKYRDYSSPDEKGDYARMFEEEYNQQLNEVLTLDDTPYNRYLKTIAADKTHNGYFSIDKKSKRLINPETGKKSTEADDVDAYDLILKDKERLLSFAEPTRFIFSHSALREGWDNPNVFVICTLKHSDNTTTRRQEVGRGLRLAVNQHGERMDNPAIVHDINLLTVVASESYKDFVSALQRELGDSLSARPSKANETYFSGKLLSTPEGELAVTPQMARQIYKYLLKNDYINDADDSISDDYHQAKNEQSLAALPDDLKPYAESIFQLIDSVFSQGSMPMPDNGRAAKSNPRNANFDKKEFQALWNRINRKAVYTVHFDTAELVAKCVAALNEKPFVEKLQYTVHRGEQRVDTTYDQIRKGEAFKITESETESYNNAIHTSVAYDLIGKISEQTKLKRSTVAEILQALSNHIFNQFKYNPEHFIAEASRIINEQKATVIIEHLTYSLTDQCYGSDIFTAAQVGQDFSKAGDKLQRHIYDYVITDSKNEREFVTELDTGKEVVVYAKLPRGFSIPTPVGDYNPDWAIAFDENKVKHIYFVAETKGSMSSMQLREIEQFKTDCAKKFFLELNDKLADNNVRYEIVDNYTNLLQMVN